MTDLQKERIAAMRQQKSTYKAISENLGIPVSTIKTFCRRNGMVTTATQAKLRCKNCGTEITQNPTARPRLFCSDHCRQTWWNRHRYQRISAKILRHTCPICGKVFSDYRGAKRKYCSQKCYHERRRSDGT